MKTLHIPPSPSPEGDMSLYEALEHLQRGTLPPVEPMSASEAVAALLRHAENHWGGWSITTEARLTLKDMLVELRERGK